MGATDVAEHALVVGVLLVVRVVRLHRNRSVTEVTLNRRPPGTLALAEEDRNRNRRENTDDCDDHQELD
jgi:hypothetical protein